MEKITLQVKPAKQRDIGRTIIRIDENIMENLNIKTGDVIEISGKKRSAGIAWLGYPQDKGLGIARMESRLYKNAGTFINGNIEIRKTTAQIAQEVILAPVLEHIRKNPKLESFVKRKLNNYPVTLDDYIFISVGTKREITFKVISITPNEVCIIRSETIIKISEKITELNFLSETQLKNLVKFLKKCDYSKEELVNELDQEIFIDKKWIREGIRDLKVKINHVIEYLLQENDLEWLISKIALDLYKKYEKTISQGQAEAVLKRVLGINLSSTGRTQLYELRKKIRRYEKFVSHFSEWTEIYDFRFNVVIMGLNSEQSSIFLPVSAIPELKDQRSTLGVRFYLKTLQISDKKVQLQLRDVSTEKKHKSLIQLAGGYSYIHWASADAHGAIIVFDKSDRETFNLARESYNELKKVNNLKFELKEKENIYVDMPIILVGLGNGAKKVTAEEGQTLAKEMGAYGYIEISELEPQNFEKIFSSLSLGIITNYQNALQRYIHEFTFKIVVVGDIRVGKTSLIKKFTQGTFNKEYIKTLGAQLSEYLEKINKDNIKSLFWDIGGSEEFHFLHQRFFRNGKAAIIVYSLGADDQDMDRFSQISDWHERIMRFCGNIPIVIVANKVDQVDETSLDNSKIQEFVKKNNLIGHYITSAKTGKGVNEIFNVIIESLYSKYKSLSAEM